MLEQQENEHGNRTKVRVRRYKNLLLQTNSKRFGHCLLIHFFEGYALVVIIKFQELHFMITLRTIQGIVDKG